MRRAVLFGLMSLALIACTDGGVRGEIARAEAQRAERAKGVEAKSQAYLAANSAKPGVRTTATGLQYSVTRAVEENLPRPELGDQVLVNYEGKLVDGTVFDSNQGVPFPAADGALIPGFTQALKQMQVGGRYKLHIPAALGYGERSEGPIPANSDLDFNVEVVAIRTREEMQQMMMQQQMMQQMQQGQAGAGAPGGPPPGQ